MASQRASQRGGRSVKTSAPAQQFPLITIAYVDVLQDNGYTKEEMSIVCESRARMGESCVRDIDPAVPIPLYLGRSTLSNVNTQEPTVAANGVFGQSGGRVGLAVLDDRAVAGYPTSCNGTADNKPFSGPAEG